MSQEIIGAKIEVDSSQSIKTVGDFRKQLKEATREVIDLGEKFGTVDQRTVAAAKRVAELRDRIADARSMADAFNPDQKFVALSQSLSGVVGGFAGVQGAMSLLGIESEEVEKQLLKVQAAMALSQGLNTVLDSVQSFKNLTAVVTNLTFVQKANTTATNLATSAMRAFGVAEDVAAAKANILKTAIIGTGIGALVVLLATGVSMLMEWANAADEAADAQERFNKTLLDGSKAELDGKLDFIARQEKLDIAKANQEGKSQAEISAIQEGWQKSRLRAYADYNNEAGNLDEKSKKMLKDAETDYQLKQIETQTKYREESERKRKEHEAKVKQESDKLRQQKIQDLNAFNEAEQKTIEERNKSVLTEEQKAQYDLSIEFSKRIEAYKKVGKDITAVVAEYERQSNFIFQQYRDEEAKQRAEELEKQKKEAEEKAKHDLEVAKELSEAKMRLDREEAENKKKALQGSAKALDDFATLAGEQTALGKGLAIASTTIQTYLAAQEAFAALAGIPYVGPALGAAAAAAAIVAGIARVKKIVEIKVPGGGGSGPSVAPPAAPSMNTTTIAPVTPQAASGGSGMNEMMGQMKQTQDKTNDTLDKLNQTLANGISANVIEGDVVAAMDRSNQIASAASIGK